jgi:hypothetical protein
LRVSIQDEYPISNTQEPIVKEGIGKQIYALSSLFIESGTQEIRKRYLFMSS